MITKEIERVGIPAAHICTVTPISKSVGANRIVPAIAIPFPVGSALETVDLEEKIRRKIITDSLEILQK